MAMSEKSEGLIAIVAAVLMLVLRAMDQNAISLGLGVLALAVVGAMMFLNANEEEAKPAKKK